MSSLRDLVSRYEVVLLDTSVIFSSLQFKKKIHASVKEETEKYDAHLKSIIYFLRLFEDENLQVIPEVVKELPHFTSTNFCRGRNLNGETLDFQRKVMEFTNYVGKLTRMITKKERVICFSKQEKDIYSRFANDFDYLKRNPPEGYKLSDTDLKLFVAGVATAETRGSSLIVSNDIGIMRAWADFLTGNSLSYRNCGFALRPTFFEFTLQNNHDVVENGKRRSY